MMTDTETGKKKNSMDISFSSINNTKTTTQPNITTSYPTTTTWKILTHNVRGINDPTKRQTIFTYCTLEDIDIAVLTETQVQNTNHKYWKHPKYDITWSNNNKGAGVAVMIKKEISKHTGMIKEYPGRGISIDLQFKGKKHIGIIGVYIPAGDGQEKKKVNKWIEGEILHRHGKNWNTIILGDFNSVTNPQVDHRSTSNKRQNSQLPTSTALRILQNLDYIDCYRTLNPITPGYT